MAFQNVKGHCALSFVFVKKCDVSHVYDECVLVMEHFNMIQTKFPVSFFGKIAMFMFVEKTERN